MSRLIRSPLVLVILPVALFAKPMRAATQTEAFERATSRGIRFLRSMQDDDGSYSAELGPGITALVTTSLLRHGLSEKDPVVAKSLRYLEQFVRDDGGIYRPNSLYRNYETSLAIMCFTEVKDPRFAEYVRRAEGFVKSIQWEDEFTSTSYGGAGYGKHKRPDLSNTSFLIEALKAAGADENDEAMRRALTFVSRCQNLETEHNTTEFAGMIGDGGFYYTCAAGGSSQAGQDASGGLRSYGSMTYAGLKSLIYAGLNKDDPRVKAAIGWIKDNYTLEENPGMRPRFDGLYYYYHTFAKSLDALGESKIVDAKGQQHDWRSELLGVLAEKQKPNGSWVNGSSRWLEGDAELVTAYALLSLSYCKPSELER